MSFFLFLPKWKLLSHVQLFGTPWTIWFMEFSCQNSGVGNLSLLQELFPTQGLNPGLLHCRQTLYCLSHQKWQVDSGMRSDRQGAWRTMDGGSLHCTGGSDQDHPQEKEMRKGKMVVWGGLTKRSEVEKRREVKVKGEKERYTHLNAEFQRIAKELGKAS